MLKFEKGFFLQILSCMPNYHQFKSDKAPRVDKNHVWQKFRDWFKLQIDNVFATQNSLIDFGPEIALVHLLMN